MNVQFQFETWQTPSFILSTVVPVCQRYVHNQLTTIISKNNTFFHRPALLITERLRESPVVELTGLGGFAVSRGFLSVENRECFVDFSCLSEATEQTSLKSMLFAVRSSTSILTDFFSWCFRIDRGRTLGDSEDGSVRSGRM